MYRVLPFLIFLGCSQKEELTLKQKEIVLDYQNWIEDNSERLQSYFDGVDWDYSARGIAKQSSKSDYYQRDLWNNKNETTLAKANPYRGEIYIITDHFLWEFIEEDYFINRDAWDNCTDTGMGVQFGWQSADVAYVLCHENAHMVRIKPHSDVYAIGEMCEELRVQEVNDWLRDCKEAGY